jgi:thiamine biosynthesis lipoprotein
MDDVPVSREVRLVLGTTAEVRLTGVDDPTGAMDLAFHALDLVEERLSLWRESELAALNRRGEAVVSDESFEVIAHALEVAEVSGGAFDPTVEPLVRAAGGFGEEARTLGERERREILHRVDYRLVHLDPTTHTVHLEDGARLVLDGLAKGDAADRALAVLRLAGAESALVDLGGSTLAVSGAPIVVDLRDPTGEARPWGAFALDNAALGSSGADQQGGHIIDPRTGEPARGVLQATVVAESAREADALSTAVFVLGAEDGLALVTRRGAAGLVLIGEEGARVIRTTPGFAAAHSLVAAPGVEVREQGEVRPREERPS